jgi:hypothetical protein
MERKPSLPRFGRGFAAAGIRDARDGTHFIGRPVLILDGRQASLSLVLFAERHLLKSYINNLLRQRA